MLKNQKKKSLIDYTYYKTVSIMKHLEQKHLRKKL